MRWLHGCEIFLVGNIIVGEKTRGGVRMGTMGSHPTFWWFPWIGHDPTTPTPTPPLCPYASCRWCIIISFGTEAYPKIDIDCHTKWVQQPLTFLLHVQYHEHSNNRKHSSNVHFPIVLMHLLPLKRGQPPHNGLNDRSQCVLHMETIALLHCAEQFQQLSIYYNLLPSSKPLTILQTQQMYDSLSYSHPP